MRDYSSFQVVWLRTLLDAGCLLLCNRAVFSTDNDSVWGDTKYREIVGDPALCIGAGPGISRGYEFEFRVFDRRDESPVHQWREIFQSVGGGVYAGQLAVSGVLIMSEKGIPVMLGTDEGIVLANPGPQPVNYLPADGGYFRSITGTEAIHRGPSMQHKGAGAWIELDKLFSEFYGSASSVDGDPRARTIKVQGERRSYMRVRVTRERRAKQFPITSLFLDCDMSEFHDQPYAVMLTNFYISPDAMPSDALPRPIYKIHSNRLAGVVKNPLAQGEDAAAWLAEKLEWMHDPQRCEKVLSDAKFQAAGKTLLEKLRPRNGFTADEAKRVSDDLRRLTAAARGGASQGDMQAASTALDHLADFLADRVVTPVRIENWQSPVPTYLAGHERWRTANMLDGRAGPELAASVYAALRAVVLDAAAPLDLRLRALDLLGEIGVAETSNLLTQMEDTLRYGRGKPVPDEFDAMFSTVKVRTGLPDDNDVARIKKQLADPNASTVVRGACLEALLLENETAGLEPLIYQTVASPLQWKLDFPTRCLFAAGLSDEGRNVLKRILVERKPEALFKPVLYLVDTSVRPGDAQWEACQEVAERLALDERSDLDLRLKASQIAARSVEHVTFRSKYIRVCALQRKPQAHRSPGPGARVPPRRDRRPSLCGRLRAGHGLRSPARSRRIEHAFREFVSPRLAAAIR